MEDYVDSNSWYYVDRGTDRFFFKNTEDAIDDFTRAIELETNNPLAYYMRGLAYLDNGKKKDARADFAMALNLGMKTAQGFLDHSL